MREELRQYVRAFRILDGTDMLIVPGTGLLTDAYGLSSWGPYNMFKWSLLAKVRGCRLLFVSVGAGPIDTALGRALVKSALSLADYRSYRDALGGEGRLSASRWPRWRSFCP
jgi:polysaccharide pyruvyl transferase WcaK-like protein